MEEIKIVLQLIILSLWCWSWWHLFQPGQALYFISRKAHRKLKKEKRIRESNKKYINEERLKDTCAPEYYYDDQIEYCDEDFEKSIYWLRPLFLCGICFASIYGTGGYFLLNYCGHIGIGIVTVISLIGVNYLLSKMFTE